MRIIRKSQKHFPKNPTQTRRTSQRVHKSETLFRGPFRAGQAGVAELPWSMAVRSSQLPVRPWCSADRGCVCSMSAGQGLCRKLQKSPAGWLRREGTGARQGLVVSLPGPGAVKNRTICTNKGSSHAVTTGNPCPGLSQPQAKAVRPTSPQQPGDTRPGAAMSPTPAPACCPLRHGHCLAGAGARSR